MLDNGCGCGGRNVNRSNCNRDMFVVHWLRNVLLLGRRRLNGLLNNWSGLGLAGLTGRFFILNGLLLQEAEDVIEDKIAIWLLCKEESLDELLPRLTAIAHLANDLDDNTTRRRSLRIHRMDEDLAVLETDGENFVVNFLRKGKKQRSVLL